MKTKSAPASTIIFDAECSLCNGVVGWLFTYAPGTVFEFVPFQSPKGQQLLTDFGFATDALETVILIEADTVLTHSDGFLKIMAGIPRWKRVASLLALVPRLLRDGIYKIAARYRVQWFGKSGSCALSLGG
ncbi:MAG: DUF393 domain-containing protein [Dokdonia sp.]|jgi:predicted DCC family thiol-disulfide oxidoreductase YuxK